MPSNFFNFRIRLGSFPFLCSAPRPPSTLLPGFVENSALFAVRNALVSCGTAPCMDVLILESVSAAQLLFDVITDGLLR